MRISIIGLALALALPGWAMAQQQEAQPKTFQLVPTETCAPFSRNVILGLCTHTQEAEAKQMIAEGTLSRAPARGPIFGSATKPAPTPPKGEADVTVRLRADDVSALDAWIAAQPDKPSRAEAIRRLLQKGLGG